MVVFLFFKSDIFKYLKDKSAILEKEPLETLAQKGQFKD